jgi:hypothetical protein
MQVNNISILGIEPRGLEPAATPGRARERQDHAQFSQTHSLNQALKDAPETRGAEVARAKGLASDLRYPPEELIGRIARLLAYSRKPSDS